MHPVAKSVIVEANLPFSDSQKWKFLVAHEVVDSPGGNLEYGAYLSRREELGVGWIARDTGESSFKKRGHSLANRRYDGVGHLVGDLCCELPFRGSRHQPAPREMIATKNTKRHKPVEIFVSFWCSLRLFSGSIQTFSSFKRA